MKPRRVLALIIFLTIIGLLVDWPQQINIRSNILGKRISWHLQKPTLSFHLGPWRFSLPQTLRQGLDLAGGVHLIFRADMDKVGANDRDKAWQALESNIHRRVDAFGLGEVAVRRTKAGNDYRLTVDIPGNIDPAQAVSLIGQTAQLNFRLENKQATAAASFPQLFSCTLYCFS